MQTALLSYFPGMYYYMDPTYVLVIIGAVICMLASANVSRTFNKYSRYHSKRGLTGAQTAEMILRSAGTVSYTHLDVYKRQEICFVIIGQALI